MHFFIEMNPPTATAQEKKVTVVGGKPRYYDPLHGIALIYEIQGKYAEAVKTYDRILQNLEEEWNFTEGEPVNVILKEKQRLLEML